MQKNVVNMLKNENVLDYNNINMFCEVNKLPKKLRNTRKHIEFV